jgi:hypothetical protein
MKHTYTPLSHTTKHDPLVANAAYDGADFSVYTKHTCLTHIQFTHKQESM